MEKQKKYTEKRNKKDVEIGNLNKARNDYLEKIKQSLLGYKSGVMKNHEENTTVCFDKRGDGQYYTYEGINNEIEKFDDEIKKLGGTVETVTFEDILKEIGVTFEFRNNEPFTEGRIIKPKKAKK